MSALDLTPSPEAQRVVFALRAIAVIGLVSIPLYYLVLKRLLEIVETVRAREPFAAANSTRLQSMAWVLLALQILGMVVSGIAKAYSTPGHPIDIHGDFSISGWLGVLLTFLLARVFAEAARMRQDLDGTV
jgi:hypothetical protein